MPVLLRDVAVQAGTSAATASRALRRDPRISTTTRDRVLAAAAQLGYRPDPALAALAAYRERRQTDHRTSTIVLIETWPRRTGRKPLSGTLVAHAAAMGYRVEVLSLDADRSQQRTAGERLVARGVRGLLLGTGTVQQDDLDLPWEHFACISVSGAPAMRLFPSVTANYAQNLRLALATLSARGYRRPGLVLDRHILTATREASLTGWGHAFAIDRDRPAPPLRLTGTDDGGRLAAWAGRHRLDAILAFAPGLIRTMQRNGLGSLGFAALDVRPDDNIAGIIQPREACLHIALDLLVARLQRHDYGPVGQPYAVQIDGVWQDGPGLRPQT
jgi:LacI family transcriptional regulator